MVEPRLKYPILLSILAALLTIGLKAAAYLLTHSVGLLSDAVESGVNLVAAVTAYLSLRYAAKPVDAEHTYGHEKIEYFSSGLEGVLILVAAGGIAWYAVRRLFVPQELESLDVGSAFTLAATLLNLAVGRRLIRVGRQARSIALVVAANILWTGADLVRRSFNGLMDHALPAAEQARARAAIEAHLGPHMAYHALRTRQAGARRFVDFHLLVPGRSTVKEAHALTGRIEAALREALPGVEVTVHIEPIEERAAWEDSALLPVEQEARRSREEAERRG